MTQSATAPVRAQNLSGGAEAAARQYLSFEIAGELYGIDILRVQEIRGWSPVTVVPNMPAHFRGLLSLRGVIVPVIDMRARFHLDTLEYGPTTVVIVAAFTTESGLKIAGMIVDGVSDVLDVRAESIQPVPDLGEQVVDSEMIEGLVEAGEHMVMLLDIDALFQSDQATTEHLTAETDSPGEEI